MAACIAAIAAVYHICRTISGLAQLRAYSVWCRKAVCKLYILNSVDKVHRNDLRKHEDWVDQEMTTFGKTETVEDLKTLQSRVRMASFMGMEEVANFIDTRMLANSQVIDNELFGSELPVRLCFPKCGIMKGLLNVFRLQFDDWLCSRDIVRCSFRWTIAVLSHFGRDWVHRNKPKSFPQANVKLHLPYHMGVPERFHRVIRAYQNTLANDALFYNGGVLDNVDIYLRNNWSEIDLSQRHMESLRNLNTKQVLYFLALMAQNGETTDILMEPVEKRKSSRLHSYSLSSENVAVSSPSSNPIHRVSTHSPSSTNSSDQSARFLRLSSNAPASLDQEPHYDEENTPIQVAPVQPVSNRNLSLPEISGSVRIRFETGFADPSFLLPSARPPRDVRIYLSDQQVMPNSEQSTIAPLSNEGTDGTQNIQDSLQERNSS